MSDSAPAKGVAKDKATARKEKKEKAAAAAPPAADPTAGLPTVDVIVPKNKAFHPQLLRAADLAVKGKSFAIKYCVQPELSNNNTPLIRKGEESIQGDANITRYICRTNPELVSLYGNGDAWKAAQIDQFLDLYTASAIATIPNLPSVLDAQLSGCTYLVGDEFSLADLSAWLTLKRSKQTENTDAFPYVTRWLSLVESYVTEAEVTAPLTLAFLKAAPTSTTSANTVKESANKSKKDTSSTATAAAVVAEGDGEGEDSGGACPPLVGAVEGAVVTRFPPEPSGYLHIGHAKAVLLNQYYAQRYKGKLLVRFDDTNPTKEKEEFEQNIMRDLESLGVKPDAISHTSDHFQTCENLARQLILAGGAYMDDTDQDTMQAERKAMINSKNRDLTPEKNLELFEAMLKGEDVDARKYCLRAKIDMQSVNGTMRDPVLYRYNGTPHHRTGEKYKAYPTYDFACPIVDSIEGVSHALRTTEYNDRDEQYHWLQAQPALNLRHVEIMSYGKINFIHTVLSKRKLTWFVENGLVDGWNDPRFPTVQGCVRRGVQLPALRNFILSQGASKRVITMEWDKFWSDNKKILEDTCPRYMAVDTHKQHVLTIDCLEHDEELVTVPLHPQKPELGSRLLRRGRKVLVDDCDLSLLKVGEEVTLLRWGNVLITHIHTDVADQPIEGKYNASATNFSKTKKITWLTYNEDITPLKLVYFDHLITKAKLEENEDFKAYVNPPDKSKLEVMAVGDPMLKLVTVGQVLQLERKGFFRCDRVFGQDGEGSPMVLFQIPDGKKK